jgi:peptidoglycan/xylan/chitin deacetylase (PgdA/CDA1 family)
MLARMDRPTPCEPRGRPFSGTVEGLRESHMPLHLPPLTTFGPLGRNDAMIDPAALAEALTGAAKWAGGQVALLLALLLGSNARGRAGILLYHAVSPSSGTPPRRSLNVTPGRFREQLKGLIDAGYRFWPLRDVIAVASDGARLPARVAVVTFDDGFASVYLHAFPVLKDLGIPATVFLTTAFIGDSDPFPFDRWGLIHRDAVPDDAWRPLSWTEIKEMEASGLVEFGTHTHSHANFKRRPDDFLQDLRRSVSVLNRRLGRRDRAFSFPFGSVRAGFIDEELIDAAKRAGVTCGLSTEIELVDTRMSPFSWGRLEIVDSDTPAIARAKLQGWFGWMRGPRELLRRVRRLASSIPSGRGRGSPRRTPSEAVRTERGAGGA